MNKFDRVISILILLQSKRLLRAAEVAERFDVSLRTVYRDIATLKQAGVPIIGDPGLGYSIMEGYRLPPIMLEEEEALALLTGEKFIGRLTDPTTQAYYSAAMTKIRATLRSTEKASLQSFDDGVLFGNSLHKTPSPFLPQLFKAIAHQQTIRIAYQKPSGEASERSLAPIGCYNDFNVWYLAAYCLNKQDYRTFRVDRIQAVHLLEEKVTQSLMSLKSYMEQQRENWNTYRNFQSFSIRFDFSVMEHVERRKYYFGFMEQTNTSNGVEVQFWYSSVEIMARFLLQFGGHATILENNALKERVLNLVQELYHHYHPSTATSTSSTPIHKD